jgi:catechol 2,3-dioxygenase
MSALQTADVKAMFRPRRLGHANLFVSDLERSIGFYNRVCGLELVRREAAVGIGFLSNGNTHHDVGLVQITPGARIGRDGYVQPSSGRGRRPGLNHFGFEMESEADLVAAYERCVASGGKVFATTDHLISRSVYLFDPEGHLLEFYADATPDWRAIFNPEREDVVSGAWTPGAEAPSTRGHYPVDPEIRRVGDALLHPLRLTHAVLVVRDLEGAQRFYSDVAGLRPIGPTGGGSVALAGTCGRSDLVLHRAGPDRPPGLRHVGFEVADERELEGAEAALRAAGESVERRVDGEGKRAIFLADPDGMRLEFHARRAAPLGAGAADPFLS